MLSILQAAILGLVEGFTEFLPISSTAHLVLASAILKVSQVDFVKSFEIIIQAGAILAVLYLYWREFLRKEVLKRLVVSFVPTGILGLIFYKFIKAHLLGNLAVILWSLLIGGLVMIFLEQRHKEAEGDYEDISKLSYGKCLALGFFQAIAMIPGVSRSAATILGGLAMKIKRKTIVEYSFLLAVPTMVAATGLDLVKNLGSFSASNVSVLAVGFVVSFFTAVVSIRFLLSYIRKHNFIKFGVYRLALVFIFVVFFLR